MSGWNSRRSRSTVSTCAAGSSMRRRPLVMRCSRSATNRRVAVARGIERRSDHLQALDPHLACVVGRRGAPSAGASVRHRVRGRRARDMSTVVVGDEPTVEQHLDARVRARACRTRFDAGVERARRGAPGSTSGTTPTRGTPRRTRGGRRRRRPGRPRAAPARTRAIAARSGSMHPTRKSVDGGAASGSSATATCPTRFTADGRLRYPAGRTLTISTANVRRGPS